MGKGDCFVRKATYVVVLFVLLCSWVRSQESPRVIVYYGEPIPEVEGAVFMNPTIDAEIGTQGDVVFTALYADPATGETMTGVWVDRAGERTCVARSGEVDEGTGRALFLPGAARIHASGAVDFFATDGSEGIDLWRWNRPDGTRQLLLETGQEIEGARITGLGSSETLIAGDDLVLGVGLEGAMFDEGTGTAIVRVGAGGASVIAMSDMPMPGAPDGTVFVRPRVDERAVVSGGAVFFFGAGENLDRAGDAFTCEGDEPLGGLFSGGSLVRPFSRYCEDCGGPQGSYTTGPLLGNSGGMVGHVGGCQRSSEQPPEEAEGLWLGMGGDLAHIPKGEGFLWDQPSADLLLTDGGEVVSSHGTTAIWSYPSGEALWRVGDPAPGTEAGATFRFFGAVRANRQGDLAIAASLAGVSGATNTGIWVRAGGGGLSLLVREGEILEVAEGVERRIFQFLSAGDKLSAGNDGRRRAFSGRDFLWVANTGRTATELALVVSKVGGAPAYVWSGEAGDDNWHTTVGDETNWNDRAGSTVEPPGASGEEEVTIAENVPPGGVVLDREDVTIGSLEAKGKLVVRKGLELSEMSMAESVVLDSLETRLVVNGGLALSGAASEWQAGELEIAGADTEVRNTGTVRVVPFDIGQGRGGQAGDEIPRFTGRGTFANSGVFEQRSSFENGAVRVLNLGNAEYRLIAGDLLAPGLDDDIFSFLSFTNSGKLIKPDDPKTADSNFDLPYVAETGSLIEVQKGRLVLRGGGEFKTGTGQESEVFLRRGRSQGAPAELVLAAAGANERTYTVRSGSVMHVRAKAASVGDPGLEDTTVFRIARGAVLNLEVDAGLNVADVFNAPAGEADVVSGSRLILDGGRIIGPGSLEALPTGAAPHEWVSGAIGVPGSGSTTRATFIGLSIRGEASKTLSGSLRAFSTVDQDARLTVDRGRIEVHGVWNMRDDVLVNPGSSGEISVVGNDDPPGALVAEATSGSTKVTLAAKLDNDGRVGVESGILSLTGEIEQLQESSLTGGDWFVGNSESTLQFPGKEIKTIGPGAFVSIDGGSIPELALEKIQGAGGFLLREAGYRVPDGLTVEKNGSLTVLAQGELVVPGSLFNMGTVRIESGGSIDVGIEYRQTEGGETIIEGLLNVRAFNARPGTRLRLDKKKGGEVRASVIIEGSMIPGQSPGVAAIVGDYTQLAGGTLEIELGGRAAGDEYDVLSVTGPATFAPGSEVVVTLIDPSGPEGQNVFNPSAGDTFDVVTATTITDEGLALRVETPLPGGKSIEYSVVDLPEGVQALRLTVIGGDGAASRFIRADCNEDGRTDISDALCLLKWLFGDGAPPGCEAAANVNGDGGTNISDVSYLLNYLFGDGSPPAAPFPGCGPGELEADEAIGCARAPGICL